MATCVTIWGDVTEFSGSALCADRYNSKAGGSSVMRQSARIGDGRVNVSKLTMAPMRKIQKVDGQKRGLCVTSAGSNEKFKSEEQSHDIQNTEVPDILIDQTPGAQGSVSKSSLTADDPTNDEEETFEVSETEKTKKPIDKIPGPGTKISVSKSSLTADDPTNDEGETFEVSETEKTKKPIDKTPGPGTKSSVSKSSLTASDLTGDEESSESMVVVDLYKLLPGLDCSDEAITKDVSATSSSDSSSFGPLRPQDSRAMIAVINKLLKLISEYLDPAITEYKLCPQRDLILAITVFLLCLIWRHLLYISPHNGNSYFP